MTRKQYVKKMRQLQWDMNKQAKKDGLKPKGKADIVLVPNWGITIPECLGSHKGEKLVSYQQAWDLASKLFKIK